MRLFGCGCGWRSEYGQKVDSMARIKWQVGYPQLHWIPLSEVLSSSISTVRGCRHHRVKHTWPLPGVICVLACGRETRCCVC
eukprot:s583_g5.t1